jgi:hypothetical protein
MKFIHNQHHQSSLSLSTGHGSMPKNKKGRRKSRHRRSHHDTLTSRSAAPTSATDNPQEDTNQGDIAPPKSNDAVAALSLGCAVARESSFSSGKKRNLETTPETATTTTTTTTMTTATDQQPGLQRPRKKRSRPTVAVAATNSTTTASGSGSSETCLDGKRDDHGMCLHYGIHDDCFVLRVPGYFQG